MQPQYTATRPQPFQHQGLPPDPYHSGQITSAPGPPRPPGLGGPPIPYSTAGGLPSSTHNQLVSNMAGMTISGGQTRYTGPGQGMPMKPGFQPQQEQPGRSSTINGTVTPTPTPPPPGIGYPPPVSTPGAPPYSMSQPPRPPGGGVGFTSVVPPGAPRSPAVYPVPSHSPVVHQGQMTNASIPPIPPHSAHMPRGPSHSAPMPPGPTYSAGMPPRPPHSTSMPLSPTHSSNMPSGPPHSTAMPPGPPHGTGMPPGPPLGTGMPPGPPHSTAMPPGPPHGTGMPPGPPLATGMPPGPPHSAAMALGPPHSAAMPPGPPHSAAMPPGPPLSAPSQPGIYSASGGEKGHMNGPAMAQPQMNGPYPQMSSMQQRYPGTTYPPTGIPSYPSQQPSHPMQPQPARKLDPDNMPSAIQVMEEDQRSRCGNFMTNQKGLVPPLVTTDFTVIDQGNASPRFIRSTMYNIPQTPDMIKQTGVPFGLVISPLANLQEGEISLPVSDFGEMGPLRCHRCKAYMCAFMQFIDGGKRFLCVFCKSSTEVPPEYFQHLDHNGQRVDKYNRPELCLGSYEFLATKEYCKNDEFPQVPAYIFVLDVSYNNIKSGMVHLLCEQMKEVLRLLPKENDTANSNVRVGFVTFNSTVHFYNIKSNLAQPQMLMVGDAEEMFIPLLDGFLCDVNESEAVIDSLLQQIPQMFADTRETETVLGPAIQAGLEALKAANCTGKLLVFASSLPIAEAPGKLKNREDRKLLGSEKEKSILTPQTAFYTNLGEECVKAGCSVDMFIFNNSYIDVATIGQVSRRTGGQMYKYTYFQADLDGERFINDLKKNISRETVFDAIMRVRTSTGVRPTEFFGCFHMSNTTDMELATMDCDKAVAVEIKHDDKLTEEDGVYVQVALLYTSCSGQRRLRIHNLSFNTCIQMADLFRNCELDTLMNFFNKQAVFRLLESSPKAVKENLVNQTAKILACYRKNCASPSSVGQLILPESMKVLPLYMNCLMKNDSVSGGPDITPDDRSFTMQYVMSTDVMSSVVYLYPHLYCLTNVDMDSSSLPSPIRCSIEKVRDDNVYLLENGLHMFLWIGSNVDSDWIRNVFGVQSFAHITDRTSLIQLDNPLSSRICEIVNNIQNQRSRHTKLTLVKQQDKLEIVFKHFLIEDRGSDGSPSYVDFLCHIHKEIRGLLT